jgi:hypothetical protein
MKIISSMLFLLIAVSNFVSSQAGSQSKSCRARSDVVGKCFRVQGRLSVYNGTPSIRLWPIGTKRLLGVLDPMDTANAPGPSILPASIAGRLDADKDVFGDFLVCPLTRAKPGRMQTICIESGRNLTVREHK